MSECRIVTNGILYRIQILTHYRFLRWSWSRWKYAYRMAGPYCDSVIAEYDTFQDAEAAIQYNARINRAKKHGWVPVGTAQDDRNPL